MENMEKIQERLNLIYLKLSLVEVRGDSVEHLFVSKVALRELLEFIQGENLKDREKEKEAGG